MVSQLFPILLWSLPALLLMVGLVLLVIGLRGRKIDNHPICRNCGFDLIGSAHSTVCPECGTQLDVDQIILGHRQRRRTPLAVGALLATPAAVVVLALGLAASRGVNFYHYKPLWLLLREGDSRAVNELARREATGLLSAEQVDAVIARALDVQGDAQRDWVPAWGDFLQNARAARKLSDEQWLRYVRQAVTFQLEARPRVRRGDPLPVRVNYGLPRVGARPTPVTYDVRLMDVRVGGEKVRDFDPLESRLSPSRAGSRVYLMSTGSGAVERLILRIPDATLARLPDGPVTVEGRLMVVALERYMKQLDVQTFPLRATFTLAPADSPTVRVIADPSLQARVRSSLQVERLRLRRGRQASAAGPAGTFEILADRPPIGLAFDVFVRDERGREVPQSACAFLRGATGRQIFLTDVDGLVDGEVDVILRSSEKRAAETVDLAEIWGGELIFRDVLLTWAGPASTRSAR